ncbi:MAG: GGDEF domain-containing response regulator [Gemmatimonadota bacterium]
MTALSLRAPVSVSSPHLERENDRPASPLVVLGIAPRRGQHAIVGRLALMAEGPDLVYEAQDKYPATLRRLHEGSVDVLLVDITTPDSLRMIEDILRQVPQTPVVVIADQADEDIAGAAVRLGAQDYLIRQQMTSAGLSRTVRLACERHRHLLAMRDLSLTDPLTSLSNRRGFFFLAEAQRRMARRSRCRCILLCADVDGLKTINDQFGHQEGDRAIVRAGELLRASLRSSDILARFGGDEFVALAYDVESSTLRLLARRISAGFKQASEEIDAPYGLSVSVGAVEFSGVDQTDLESLLAQADRVLYRRKRRRPANVPIPSFPLRNERRRPTLAR